MATDKQEVTISLLREGQILSCVLSPLGSNYTFVMTLQNGAGEQCRAIYKPRDGEAPLWDFPPGTLYKREYAAFLLSEILGWHFIPETVLRQGPYGIGSVQRLVEWDRTADYDAIRASHREDLRMIACFDLIANNADRKPGHVIKGIDGHIWGIDHGLTFNAVPKLRTVIWDFWGEPLPPRLLLPLQAFLQELKVPGDRVKELIGLLDQQEVVALGQRVGATVSAKSFPRLRYR